MTIQAKAIGQDEIGQQLDSWSDVATIWASVTDVSGREYVAAGAMQNSAQTKILIRYRAGVDESMRVIHAGVTYQIEAILGQDRISLMLMCSRLSQ